MMSLGTVDVLRFVDPICKFTVTGTNRSQNLTSSSSLPFLIDFGTASPSWVLPYAPIALQISYVDLNIHALTAQERDLEIGHQVVALSNWRFINSC